MRTSRNLLFLFILLVHTTTKAQSQTYLGIFPTIDHSGDLTQKLNYNFYYFGAFPLVNAKNADIKNDARLLLFYSEQSLSYLITKKLSATASYVFQAFNATNDVLITENRFYLQTAYTPSMRNINFKHRIRFDGRFIKNPSTGETPFTHRLRYLIGVDFPVSKKNPKIYLTAYEELFFNTVKAANPIYEENWAYAAIGKQINKQNKLEAGILYITWYTGNNSWLNQFYLQLTWINHVNFKKKKMN